MGDRKAGRGIRVDGVVDIECANWIHYVVGAVYTPMSGARTFRTVETLVDHLLAAGGTWWAWSGGTYDFLCIAKELHRRGLPCRIHAGGSRATRLECGALKLCDAYALVPMDLDSACGLAGEAPVGPLGWRCQCGQQCGGYCRISTHLSESRLRELGGYCIEDARKGYKILAALMTWAAAHGVVLRGTIGGSAWATAEKMIGLPEVDWHYSTWNRVREGYYGGRTTVGHAHAPGGAHYDISSSYPASLARVAVPVGGPIELGCTDAALAYAARSPGIYRVTVDVPEMDLPPLPYRLPSGRLSFPFGSLTGSWPANELAAAEARGCRIQAFHSAVAWESSAVLFDGFVETFWAHRATAGKSSALGKWLRLFLNALPGKLAEQPERTGIAMFPDIESIFLCTGKSERSLASGCTAAHCTERCGRWHPLDPLCTIWGIPRWRIGSGAHVQWAAYTLADARLSWLTGAEQAGPENLLYGATDSLWLRRGAPDDVGDGCGQWEYQGMLGDWKCWGPNQYQYVADTGEVVVRVAGLHASSAKAWITEHEREIVEARGVMTFREGAAAGDLFSRRTRTIHRPEETGWRGDRILASGSGKTYPVDREAIEERDRSRARQTARAK